MNHPRVIRSLLVFIGVLLLFSGGFVGPAGAQTVVVNSVAQLETALADAAAGNVTDIRIATGTYNISSVLSLEPPPGGATITLQNAGDGPVILHSASGGRILQAGHSRGTGIFVVTGLTFSGTRGGQPAINNSANMITIADCTFLDNDVGFYMDSSDRKVEFVNNTFTQNRTAIFLDCHGPVTVRNTTVANNTDVGIHGLYPQCSNSVNVLANSIVSGNGRDCDGRPDQRVASMDRDGTCGAMTVDPQLAALADNGGLVQTMALPAGSPAVAGGDPSTCPSTDARGASRPIPSIFGPPHPKCDIGAFERSGEFQAQSATGAGPVSFATSTGTFVNFHAVKENTLPTAGKPPGVTFPFGLFDWTVIDLTPGQIVTVTLTFPSPVPVPPQYWKVNTGTGLWTNVCLLLPCVVNPSSPKVLQLTITDGGVGDLDGIVNGVIRDPGGLGVSAGGPPVARCKDVTVSTSPGICSAMSASVDAGSSDPDGDSITITQSPTGPFPLGTTAVTLTVTDSHGASAQCRATVTVVDKEPPKTTCPAAITKECTGPTGTDVSVVPSASDNCSAVTASRSPSGPFPVSSTAVTCTATDTAGNTSACTTPVKVVDTTPPVVTCERVRKPRGNDKDDDRERRKYRDAKHKDHDDDDDDEVFFRVSASDVCSTPKLTIGGIPLANGETIGIEQSRKPGVRLVEIEDGIREFKVGPGQAMITATDAAGNTATAVCPVPPKDRDDDKGRDRDDDKE